MDTYLTAIGWWNFVGSLVMIGFLNEQFGRKMLNEWTRIFAVPFSLNYWSRFWLAWATGLNIFFGLVNILAVGRTTGEFRIFIVLFDLVAYLMFIVLALVGMRAGKTGSGIYSVFLIFGIWITWAVITLLYP